MAERGTSGKNILETARRFGVTSPPRSEGPGLLWGLGSVSQAAVYAQSHWSCSESPHHP